MSSIDSLLFFFYEIENFIILITTFKKLKKNVLTIFKVTMCVFFVLNKLFL